MSFFILEIYAKKCYNINVFLIQEVKYGKSALYSPRFRRTV